MFLDNVLLCACPLADPGGTHPARPQTFAVLWFFLCPKRLISSFLFARFDRNPFVNKRLTAIGPKHANTSLIHWFSTPTPADKLLAHPLRSNPGPTTAPAYVHVHHNMCPDLNSVVTIDYLYVYGCHLWNLFIAFWQQVINSQWYTCTVLSQKSVYCKILHK